MKILEFKLSHDDWKMLAGTELGAHMVSNLFSILIEEDDLELIYKCTDWLEESATGLWYVSSSNPGYWTFYFNHTMDRANLLDILKLPG